MISTVIDSLMFELVAAVKDKRLNDFRCAYKEYKKERVSRLAPLLLTLLIFMLDRGTIQWDSNVFCCCGFACAAFVCVRKFISAPV